MRAAVVDLGAGSASLLHLLQFERTGIAVLRGASQVLPSRFIALVPALPVRDFRVCLVRTPLYR